MIKARSWVSLDLALTNRRKLTCLVSLGGSHGRKSTGMNTTLDSIEHLNNIFYPSGSSLDWGRDIQLEVSTQEDTSHWRLVSSRVPR